MPVTVIVNTHGTVATCGQDFVTNKVPVVSRGVDVGVVTPSSVQVTFSPGLGHIRFAHSCSWLLSHPLSDAS